MSGNCPDTTPQAVRVAVPIDILCEQAYAPPSMSMADRVELLQGTLDLLILRTLQLGPAHGHAIAKAIEHSSEDVLLVDYEPVSREGNQL